MTGEELRTYRTKILMSRAQFANVLGVAAGTVRNWEQGIRPIPRYIIAHLNTLSDLNREMAAAGRRVSRGRH